MKSIYINTKVTRLRNPAVAAGYEPALGPGRPSSRTAWSRIRFRGNRCLSLCDPTSSCSSSSITSTVGETSRSVKPVSTTESHCASSSTVRANSAWVSSREFINAPKFSGLVRDLMLDMSGWKFAFGDDWIVSNSGELGREGNDVVPPAGCGLSPALIGATEMGEDG
jgi:hypothetical protein